MYLSFRELQDFLKRFVFALPEAAPIERWGVSALAWGRDDTSCRSLRGRMVTGRGDICRRPAGRQRREPLASAARHQRASRQVAAAEDGGRHRGAERRAGRIEFLWIIAGS